jgi:hypothetical protein
VCHLEPGVVQSGTTPGYEIEPLRGSKSSCENVRDMWFLKKNLARKSINRMGRIYRILNPTYPAYPVAIAIMQPDRVEILLVLSQTVISHKGTKTQREAKTLLGLLCVLCGFL